MKVKLLPNWDYIHAYRINNLNDIKVLLRWKVKHLIKMKKILGLQEANPVPILPYHEANLRE